MFDLRKGLKIARGLFLITSPGQCTHPAHTTWYNWYNVFYSWKKNTWTSVLACRPHVQASFSMNEDIEYTTIHRWPKLWEPTNFDSVRRGSNPPKAMQGERRVCQHASKCRSDESSSSSKKFHQNGLPVRRSARNHKKHHLLKKEQVLLTPAILQSYRSALQTIYCTFNFKKFVHGLRRFLKNNTAVNDD